MGEAWKDLLANHSHLMISSFRETGLSLKIDGTEDHTLDFGDHEPFGPMIPSEDEMGGSDSDTESEEPLPRPQPVPRDESEDVESKRSEA